MQPVVTDVACSMVCGVSVSMCWADGELCKYGWTNRDAVWAL